MKDEIIKTKEWEELQTIYNFLLNTTAGTKIVEENKIKVSFDNLQKLSEVIN